MENIKQKLNRFRARHALIQRYSYLTEVDKVMEEYQVAQVMAGGDEKFLAAGRKTLVETQGRIREQQKLVEFLKNIK